MGQLAQEESHTISPSPQVHVEPLQIWSPLQTSPPHLQVPVVRSQANPGAHAGVHSEVPASGLTLSQEEHMQAKQDW